MPHITSVGLHVTLRGLARAGALLLFAVCGCLTAAAQTTNFVELATPDAAGTQSSNGPSTKPRSSDDGRFVVFESNAQNLVPNDANGFVIDVFVRDLQLDTTQIVSVNAAGTGSGNGKSDGASITPDGRYVVFQSEAENLLADKMTGLHVYVRDLVAQKTTLASFDGSGVPTTTPSYEASITPDGRYVIFRNGDEIYRRDMVAGTTALVSADTGASDHLASDASITPNGRYVVFQSLTGDFFSGTSRTNVFRRDLQTNTTALVSVNHAGAEGGNGNSIDAVVSDDGQVVAFTSGATNLVGPDNPIKPTTSVYVRNFADNTTTLVSEPQVFVGSTPTIPPSFMPQISADGRYVLYLRTETINGGDLNREAFRDRVFRRDRQTGALLELPFVPTGMCDQGQGFACLGTVTAFVMSRDGRYVAYRQHERSKELSHLPLPFSYAIVVHDMVTGGAEVINGFSGLPFNITDEYPRILSPGSVVAGGKVAFSSGVSHSPTDTNIQEDIYFYAPAARTSFAFNRASYNVGEDGSRLPTHVILVRREGSAVDTPATVKLTTSDGTTTAGSDYVQLSETLTFAPGETEKTVIVQIINDDVLEPAETLNLTLSDPTGNSTLGGQSSATLTIGDNDLHTVQFIPPVSSFDNYAYEVQGSVLVTVKRTGATTQPVSVDYTSSDGTASERSDYIAASGRVTFAPGETTKTIRVFIVNDTYVETDETFTLTLSNLRGANAVLGAATTQQMTVFSDDAVPAANPVDDTQFFVLQHYIDFLGREPDVSGFAFWVNEIESCGADARCRDVKRINVSAAFFLSIEFQETGYLVERVYKAAYGDTTSPNVSGTVPVVRVRELLADTQQIGQGVRVNVGNWQAQLEANKRDYALDFVGRQRFLSAFPASMTAAEFVTRLDQNAGQVFSDDERSQLVSALASAPADAQKRAAALRQVAEHAELRRRELRRAFVLMQYFGYLRRNPDDPQDADFRGWKFWLDKLDQFNGNFVSAEMVKAFLSSDEYRKRFGQ